MRGVPAVAHQQGRKDSCVFSSADSCVFSCAGSGSNDGCVVFVSSGWAGGVGGLGWGRRGRWFSCSYPGATSYPGRALGRVEVPVASMAACFFCRLGGWVGSSRTEPRAVVQLARVPRDERGRGTCDIGHTTSGIGLGAVNGGGPGTVLLELCMAFRASYDVNS